MSALHPGDVARTRAVLSAFTPERPLMVPESVWREASRIPELADMMCRMEKVQAVCVTKSSKR
jgi:hypothetical protein